MAKYPSFKASIARAQKEAQRAKQKRKREAKVMASIAAHRKAEKKAASNLPSLVRVGRGDPSKADPSMRTLLDCKTIEEVDEYAREWADKFHGKVSRAVERRKIDPEMVSIVDALIAKPGALSKPMLVSRFVGDEAYPGLQQRLVAMMESHPDFEMAFLTFISGDGETSHKETCIELFESQKRVKGTARAISPHFFGITEFALFNSGTHPAGGKTVQRHEHVLVWGEGVIGKAHEIAEKHKGRYPPNFTGARVIDVRPVATNPLNLLRICWYMMKPPAKCMNWKPGKDGKPGHMNHSEKGDRYVCYLRLAQIRSMMPFEAATFAGGEGIMIRSQIIGYLRAAVKSHAESERQTLHPDAVASFWVKLAKALNFRWNLPVIKTSG